MNMHLYDDPMQLLRVTSVSVTYSLLPSWNSRCVWYSATVCHRRVTVIQWRYSVYRAKLKYTEESSSTYIVITGLPLRFRASFELTLKFILPIFAY